MAPMFSVVIPTFNREKLLSIAIRSVLAQSIEDWELIIVDNHSNDQTQDLINRIDDDRIRFFKLQNFGSISKSRNLGITKALGEWVAFLDSDDWWAPNKLETCLSSLNENVDFIYHDMEVESQFFFRRNLVCRQLKSPIFVDLILNGNPIAASSVVARKSLFNQINGMDESIEMVTTADFNTWLKMSLISEKFFRIPEFLGHYRFHENNLSNDRILEANLLAISEFLPNLSKSKQRRAIANLKYTQARVNFLSKNFNEVNKYLFSSILSSRFDQKIKSMYMFIYVIAAKFGIGVRNE